MSSRKTIVICVMPAPDGLAQYGSLPPVLKAGEIANSRGDKVIWTCSDCFREIISSNFPKNEIFSYPDPTLYALPKIFQKPFIWMLDQDLPQWMMPSLKKEKTTEWIFDSYLTIGLGKQDFFDEAVLTVLKVLVERNVDKILCFADPVGLIAAEIAGIPVMNFNNLMPVGEAGGKGATQFNATIAKTMRKFSPDKHNVKPFSKIYTDKDQFQMISSLERAGTDSGSRSKVYIAGFELKKAKIRKNVQPLDEQALANQRVAFAYFGSVSISFKLAKKVLAEAFEIINRKSKSNKPWHCYVGSQFVESAHSIGNVHYAPYYDARVLFKYADLTFAHGGLMTLFDSLSHGVPMILVPGSLYERRFNSEEVVATGSGVMLEIDEFTPEKCALIVLDEPRIKTMSENAKKAQQRIKGACTLTDAFELSETAWESKPDLEKKESVATYLQNKGYLK